MNHSPPGRRIRSDLRQHAFTLPELLVVVTIIGLLASLALPAFKKALAQSRRSTCLSNERQIGQALFLYASEHNNALPPVWANYPSQPVSMDDQWNTAIWTYCGYSTSSYQYAVNDTCTRKNMNVTKKNLFRCPEIWGNPPCPTGVTINANRMSYGLNSAVLGQLSGGSWTPPVPNSWVPPIPLAAVATPSSTAMVIECSYLLGSQSGFALYWGLIPHDGGLNVLFYDGHIQYLKLGEIPTSSTDRFWTGQ